MTYNEKKAAKMLQLEKDNKYLLKQIFKLAANKSEILKRIKEHPRKEQLKPDRRPIHIKRLVKVLGVNQRTILLLDSREFFHRYFPWELQAFNLVEVEKFIKSLPIL
ncbi:MAG: hypothetical protein P4L34_09695 [Paludibacter sp.]|nr:hypothetical protein [Paludibacter sp.]